MNRQGMANQEALGNQEAKAAEQTQGSRTASAGGERHPLYRTFRFNITVLCAELRLPAGQFGKSTILCRDAALTIEQVATQRDETLALLRELRNDIAKLKWGQSFPGRNHALMDRVEAALASGATA